MKYYSDLTKKFYETSNECVEAEEVFLEAQAREKEEKERKASERKDRAEKVEKARKKMVKAQQEYRDELNAFCRDYGHYHYSSTSADDIPTLFTSLFDIFN